MLVPDEDAGPISTGNSKVQAAREAHDSARIGQLLPASRQSGRHGSLT
jgi:hypothetical protein